VVFSTKNELWLPDHMQTLNVALKGTFNNLIGTVQQQTMICQGNLSHISSAMQRAIKHAHTYQLSSIAPDKRKKSASIYEDKSAP